MDPRCGLDRLYGEEISFSCQDLNKYPSACSVVIIPITLFLQPQAKSGSGFIQGLDKK